MALTLKFPLIEALKVRFFSKLTFRKTLMILFVVVIFAFCISNVSNLKMSGLKKYISITSFKVRTNPLSYTSNPSYVDFKGNITLHKKWKKILKKLKKEPEWIAFISKPSQLLPVYYTFGKGDKVHFLWNRKNLSGAVVDNGVYQIKIILTGGWYIFGAKTFKLNIYN